VDPPSHQTQGVYTGKFRTLYKNRSIGPVIGFRRENYSGDTSYTGEYAYNLKVNKYIAMFVNKKHNQNHFNRIDSINDNIKGAFTVIPLDSAVNNF